MRIVEFINGYEEHNDLNPKIWDGDSLRQEVKIKLLQIAQEFKEFIDIDVPVIDVHITGGQVSYHYTDQSDLDLHLIIDYNRIQCDQEVAELLDTKRMLFKKQHDIKIHGIPIEPGTEDVNKPTVSSAYSLKTDSWIREPKNYSGKINDKEVQKQSEYWGKIIRSVLAKKDLETAQKCIKMIRKYRKLGLKQTGEYGVENLVYKTLRNSNLIADLMNFISDAKDNNLSIK